MNDKESCLSNMNGIDPTKLNTNQKRTTIRKPSLTRMSLLAELFGKYNRAPKVEISIREYINVK